MSARRVRIIGWWLAAMVVGAGSATAQVPRAAGEEARVRAVGAEVAKLLEARSYEPALQMARKVAAHRWSEPRASGIAHYTLGWAAAAVADAGAGGEPLAVYREAAGAYETFLKAYPAHVAASENLARVYLRLREFESATRVLTAVLASDTRDVPLRYRVQVALGDVSAESGNADGALRGYMAAYASVPEDALAPLRLVELFRQNPDRDPRPLMDACRRFEASGVTGAALEGYALMAMASRAERGLREEALVRWLDGAVRGNVFTLAGATALLGAPPSAAPASRREATESPAFASLRQVLRAPGEAKAQDLGWWSGDVFKAHVVAEVLRALAAAGQGTGGRDAPDDQDLRTEEHLLELATKVAPDDFAYQGRAELKDRFPARLMAKLDLAKLYSAHRGFDPDGAKFRALEERLLDEKTMAYWEQNLPLIEKYHTVLGLIYADPNRARWKGDRLHSAPYHLARAVETVQRMARRSPAEFQPLPHLTLIHARGIADDPQQATRAQELFSNAAQGFLDEGGLAPAAEALKGMHALEQTYELPPTNRGNDLQRILEFRVQTQTQASIDFQDVRVRSGEVFDRTGTLDPVFLQRQKTETLIDLTQSAIKRDDSVAANELRDLTAAALVERPGATQATVAAYERLNVSTPSVQPADGATTTAPTSTTPILGDPKRTFVPREQTDQLVDTKELEKRLNKRTRATEATGGGG
jgi:tetratricopeptide (TPR) repeat protein